MKTVVIRPACIALLVIASILATSATAWASPHARGPPTTPMIPAGTVIHAPSCEQPPSQAVRDRATYSLAELKRYGLPLREPGESFEHWARAVRAAKTRFCDLTVSTLRATSDQHFTNWDGNIADEPNIFNPETYSEIDFDFYLPCVTHGQSDAHAIFWAGLGGWNNSNLVQNGADAHRVYVANNGWYTIYQAWVENVAYTPNPGINYAYSVSCGDHMWVRAGGSGGSNCNYSSDLNTGSYTNQCYGPGANQTSAEGITERPYDGSIGTNTILSNFGSVSFLGVGITDNGNYKAMNQVNHDYSNMWSYDQSYTLATVGPIYNVPNDSPYDGYDMFWQRYS